MLEMKSKKLIRTSNTNENPSFSMMFSAVYRTSSAIYRTSNCDRNLALDRWNYECLKSKARN